MALTKIPASLLDTSGGFDLQGNITLGDSEKILLGASSDLQIYHDESGGHSRIDDTGTGGLVVRGSQILLEKYGGGYMINAIADGASELYHAGNKKLETTSTGATITGNLAVTGDLDITGDINSYNVTDLDVTDKTITLGAGQTEANSGGSGIIIDGSSASILWDETNTSWDFNNPVTIERAATADMLIAETTSNNTRSFLTTKSKDSSGNSLQLKLGTLGDGPYGMLFTFTNHPLTFATNNAAPQMTLDTSGNVGIGTSSPLAPLDVVRGGTTGLSSVNARTALLVQNNLSNGTVVSINAKNTGYSGIFLGDQDNEAICQIQYVHTDDKLKFFTNGGGYNPLTLSGTNVGIGTSSPSFPLHISSSSTDVAKFQTSGSYAYTRFQNSSKTWALSVGSSFSFYDEAASATRIVIDSSGNLLLGGASSNDSSSSMAAQTPNLYVPGYTSLGGLRIKGTDTGNTIYKTGGPFGLTLGDTNIITLSNSDSTARLNSGNWEVLSGGQLRAYRSGNSAYGALFMDTGENLFIRNSWAVKDIVFNRDGKVLIGDSASHTDDLLQIETPASGGGHGIQIRRNDSNSDQGIGHIQFGNNTDTDLAKISAKTDGSTDNAALLFSTQNDGGGLTERMRINHDGEVGIGTQNPSSTLHVEGTTRSNTYDIGSTESQFGFDRYKIRELNNLLYAADKRFGGVSGSSNLQAQMFDGNQDNGYSISAGTTYVVTIDLNQTITYPSGDAYISFYHIYNDFQSVSGRMYYTAGPNSGTWLNMGSAETIRGSAGSGSRLVKLSGAGSVYVGKFEFTFVAKSTQDLIVTDIAFFGTRVAGRDFRPYLRTDTAQNLTEDITFKNSSTGTVGSIVVGGGSTAFNTSSDYRLKENVLQITNATDKVNQLKPITFNWISDDTDTPISGFLAHEVQEVVPEAVTGEKDATVPPELFTENDPLPDGVSVGDVKDPRGQIDPQQLDQSKLVPLLTKAIQEQQTIIDDLKSRIETLEG